MSEFASDYLKDSQTTFQKVVDQIWDNLESFERTFKPTGIIYAMSLVVYQDGSQRVEVSTFEETLNLSTKDVLAWLESLEGK